MKMYSLTWSEVKVKSLKHGQCISLRDELSVSQNIDLSKQETCQFTNSK